MPTQPITTTISENKGYGAEEASKNIINAINAIANIKTEQIKFQKSLMLDQLARERNLKDYQRKKDIDFEQQKKESRYFLDQEKAINSDQSIPQNMQPITQTVPGPDGGMITGKAEGEYPEALPAIPTIDGITLAKPPSKIRYEPGKGLVRNPDFDKPESQSYAGLYAKMASGQAISEGEKKFALEYNGYKQDKITKKAYLFKLPPKQEDIKQKRTGGILGYGPGSSISPEINEETMTVIRNVKTLSDLEELMDKRDEYEAAGVDLQYVLDYFQEEKK